MSVFAHVDGLGEALETCITDSILAWRKQYRPANETVDTIAEHLTQVETSLSLRPGGVVLLTVQVKGRGFLKEDVQCFRLQRRRAGEWVTTASSLNRK